MHPMLNIAVRAARKAGNLITRYYETQNCVRNQEKNNNFAFIVDKMAGTIITETIYKYYPRHAISYKEDDECENPNRPNQDVKWIINPVDGITNFIKRLPHFAVSIAICVKGQTETAMIYDPIRNELFTATRGQGAQLNGYRLRVSNTRNLDRAILSIDFPFKIGQYSTMHTNILYKLLTEYADFRRTGSSALDLAYVAAGRIDGYFKIGPKPEDVVAGALISREAGALVCDFSGNHNYTLTGSDNILAGNSRIVQSMLESIRNN